MARPKISVVIIGKNEERNVTDCLKSVDGWADQIVFVDDFSADRTVELVNQFSRVKVVQRAMEQEGRHRNFGAAQADHDWIMILDCDERATPELLAEIDTLFETRDDRAVAFWVPRKNYIGDYWLRHGGWYPAPHMKLYNRKFFRWKESVYDVVHPGMEFTQPGYRQGPNLSNHLIHHNYKNVEDFIRKTNRLTTLDGIKWYLDGRNMGMGRAFRRTVDRFLRRYVRKEGWKDGYYGFITAVLSGFYELAAYSKLREIRQRGYYLKECGITDEMLAEAPLFAEPSRWRKFMTAVKATPKSWKAAWRNVQGKRCEAEVDILGRLVGPEGVCVDAGGAYGRTMYALAKSARRGRVLGFEPVRFNMSVLKQVKAIFLLNNVTLHKLALGRKSGKIYAVSPVKTTGKVGYALSYLSPKVIPNTECERVDVVTLDGFLEERPLDRLDILICDTEGSELAVLQGAAQTIDKFRPVVMASVEDYRLQRCGDNQSGVAEFFRDKGYGFYSLQDGRLTFVQELKEEANYFFLPEEKSADIIARLNPSAAA
ncbi:MAG: FkbM family methyltransferase [Candidatus Omnitrophica bacterium]|nr:FkbM family methyltransferase [Candidatus Omnitrophota bacterium]